MRTASLVSIAMLVFVVLIVFPVVTEAQKSEIDRLRQEVAELKAEMRAREKALNRQLDESKARLRAKLEARKQAIRKREELESRAASVERRLREAKRANERAGNTLVELKEQMVTLVKAVRQLQTERVALERSAARHERGVHLALTLMKDLLKRPALDPEVRLEVLRTAARMGPTAAPLKPAIASLPTTGDPKLAKARKEALDRIAPAKKM